MPILRLFIAPGWPQEHRECTWALCSPGGDILQHGRSEPRHWPGVVLPETDQEKGSSAEPQACDLILYGSQINALSVQLPRGAAGQRPEVIAAACEELLLADPADCQFSPPPDGFDATGEDGRLCLAFIERARLSALCATLTGLGLQPRSAWPLGFLLPEADGRRMAWAENGTLTLPHPDGSFLDLDLAGELAFWQEQLAADGFALPQPVVKRENDASCRQQLEQAIAAGYLSEAPGTLSLGALRLPPPGGLLNGALAPPRASRRLLDQWRWPLRLLAGLALFACTLLLLDWGRLNWQARNYRQDIEAQYRQAFPQGALVDPVLQMQRQVDRLRQDAGQLASTDLLTLLAPLGEIDGELETRRLDYDGKRLDVVATLAPADLAAIGERARQLGLWLEIGQRETQGNRLTANFSLSPDSAR